MEDNIYKEMYLKLFKETTDAIAHLQKAQTEAEDIYLNAFYEETKQTPSKIHLIREQSKEES